jgi:uncharacterized membrane protein
MLTDNVVLLLALITGPVYILAGLLLKNRPPGSINWAFGYRTRRAMKSQAHWDFAQRYAGKELITWGTVYVLTSVVSSFFITSSGPGILLSMALLLIFSIIPIIRTESRLKKEFGEY